MQTVPILYSFRRCPYAMRARMAIAVSGRKVELREVVLRDKPLEMIAVSPKATVPVLVHEQLVLEESLEIMRWALNENDTEGWLCDVDESLIAENDGPFKRALDRYKYPHRYDLNDGTTDRDTAMRHLGILNERLQDRLYLAGTTVTFTDIALFPFVRQFAATDLTWFQSQEISGLQRWLDALVTSDLFSSAMIRHPQWRAGDAPVYFP